MKIELSNNSITLISENEAERYYLAKLHRDNDCGRLRDEDHITELSLDLHKG